MINWSETHSTNVKCLIGYVPYSQLRRGGYVQGTMPSVPLWCHLLDCEICYISVASSPSFALETQARAVRRTLPPIVIVLSTFNYVSRESFSQASMKQGIMILINIQGLHFADWWTRVPALSTSLSLSSWPGVKKNITSINKVALL